MTVDIMVVAPCWADQPCERLNMRQENLSRHAVLSDIAPFDQKTGDLRIVIETPKGSRNKYK
jgi:hypothetical protein